MFDYGGRDRINPERAAKAANCISDAFDWHSTPEGVAFWASVTSKLLRVSDGLLPQEPIGQTSEASGLDQLRAELAETKRVCAELDTTIARLRRRLVAADFTTFPR